MKNRLERRKAKRLGAVEVIHTSIMVCPTNDGDKFFWFVVPENLDPNMFNFARVDWGEVIDIEPGITLKVKTPHGKHTIELHGPFDSKAECDKDLERVICRGAPVEDGGILDQATLDLIRRRTPRDDVH
jgi:hypothetical protein